jgi:hypothetical protein
MYGQSNLFVFFYKVLAEVRCLNKAICKTAPLAKGIENHLTAIGATALALILAKDYNLLRTIRLGKEGWLRHRVDKGRLSFGGILFTARGTDERLAYLLETIINRFRPYEGDLATGGTVYLSCTRFIHERFGGR